MPAEWAPHERTLIAWPTRRELWRTEFEAAKREYAAVARAVARFEHVLMVANQGDGREARDHCGSDVEVVELPIDDSWLRDSGPLFVVGGGERVGVDFEFNAWGEKYEPYDRDRELPVKLLEQLGIPCRAAPFVLEGGAITVDGEGTAVVTEQCLLNPNRNPSVTREMVESTLQEYLGIERTVWLGKGLAEDLDTDGHVDLIAAFTASGRVILQVVNDPRNPNFENCQENLECLTGATDAQGRSIEVVEFAPLAYLVIDGELIAASYLNFYICNGGVIVPLAGESQDTKALELLAAAFPERKVVGVETPTIAYGGGGVHCITQQVPEMTS